MKAWLHVPSHSPILDVCVCVYYQYFITFWLIYYLNEDVGFRFSVEVGEATSGGDALVQLFDGRLSLVRLSRDLIGVVEEVGVDQLDVITELDSERSPLIIPSRRCSDIGPQYVLYRWLIEQGYSSSNAKGRGSCTSPTYTPRLLQILQGIVGRDLEITYIFTCTTTMIYLHNTIFSCKNAGWCSVVPSLTAFITAMKKKKRFYHGCEKSCEGRPGYEAIRMVHAVVCGCQ